MKTTSHKLIIMLLVAMLLAVAIPYISSAHALQSDEFDGSGQNLQSFWEVQNTFWHVQEGNEGSYTLSDGNLVVEGAFYQNLWDGDWTRRFYQVTDQERFSVETSLIFDHKDVCAVAGLIIKSPTQNEWVTLKMWGQSAEGAFGNQPNTAKLEFQHRERHLLAAFGYNPAGGNIPIALRLDRDGDTYSAWYKPDAQGEWVFTGETTVALQGPLEVGIFTGICQDEAPGNLTVTFDNFRATTDATELAQQAQAGPKIEGPWLWMIVPTGDNDGVRSGIDFLAEASNGSVTETAIATAGARAGDIVGNKRWTPGKIAPTGGNNMNDLVNAIGLGTGDVDNHVAYGSIALESPSEQATTMFVGTDDTVKVWLNGVLVHSNPLGGGAAGYQESFPVTLKQGKNILLVAAYEFWGGWSGFFGFQKGTTYTVLPPETSTTPPVDITQGYSQIYVDAVNGVNATTGRGSADKPYKTITLALAISARNNLPDPWYVRILPGTYHADPSKPVQEREIFPLKLRNGMIIEGTTNANECIIDAQHLGETKVPILLGENVGGVHIRNLTIQNMLNVDRGKIGTQAQIILTGTAASPNTLEGCIIHSVDKGIYITHGLWTDIPLVLVANTFSNHPGIGVWALNSVVATNNTFDGNRMGGLKAGGRFIDDWVSVETTGNITENIFRNNSGSFDFGALYLTGTLNGNISNNTFIGNSAHNTMYITNMTGDVTHNTFENNGTDDGRNGYILIFTINGNFTHNSVTGQSRQLDFRNITGDIAYNEFTENLGFVDVENLTGKVTHNTFDSNINSIYSSLSGIRINNRDNSEDTVEISNNIFFNNKSSHTEIGVSSVHMTNGPAHFINNLFMTTLESTEEEFAPAIKIDSPGCRFHNNIFVGMQTAIYVEGTDTVPITHNIFYSIGRDIVSQAGSGLGNDLELWELLAGNASNNIALVPLFVDPLNEKDFHLKPISPAIDAGTNAYVPAVDFDGVDRPVGDTVDIGPYEYVGDKEDTTFELGAWDVDQNGVVNILDLVIVSQNFGLSPPTNPRADVTGDGQVNILDLVTIAQHFGESAGASPSANVYVPEYIEPETVQTWIALAQVADDGSAVFREGIANLKRLLAVNTPQKTALLANYPNPFNPETWIPYQLAKPAEVTLHIYAPDGKLVRTLALGHQAVGKYHERSRAAYWDGKNEVGESVASGVYFYTLTAGDFSATRKMLIRK